MKSAQGSWPIVVRNVLAVIAGIAVGSAVNWGLIVSSPSLIAPPPGVDVNNAASLAAAMHLFEPRHFVMPFLAHALGTCAGAAAACLLAASRRAAMAFGIGGVFLIGGIAASFMIPAPAWFKALDIGLAYLPMAWLGWGLGCWLRPEPAATRS